MNHYPPDTAEGETLRSWQGTTRMQWKEEFQMDFRGTDCWNDYSISDLHIFREGMGLFEN